MTANEESRYQMLLQVAAGRRRRRTTALVNSTETAWVEAVATPTAAAIRGSISKVGMDGGPWARGRYGGAKSCRTLAIARGPCQPAGLRCIATATAMIYMREAPC